jgi:hypothetical protein
MSNAFQRTLKFVVGQASTQPVGRQVQIFEDLSVICGDESEANEFRALAKSFKEAEAHLQKVQLSLFSNNQ